MEIAPLHRKGSLGDGARRGHSAPLVAPEQHDGSALAAADEKTDMAEALLATAIGLFAAIPALIFFNNLQGVVAKFQARMESFADEFSSILSRQIDQHVGGERDRAA